jgi:hypothetical protein
MTERANKITLADDDYYIAHSLAPRLFSNYNVSDTYSVSFIKSKAEIFVFRWACSERELVSITVPWDNAQNLSYTRI